MHASSSRPLAAARPAHRRALLPALPILLLALAGCGKEKPAPPPPPPPEVAVVAIEPRTIAIEYSFVGQTAASKTVEIRARVSGFLQKREFEEGKPIQAGSTLFRIDPRSFEADLAIAQARLAQAEARQSLAEQEITRYSEAAGSGAASQREVDQARSELDDAKAAGNLARAEVEKAQLDLSYTNIVTPVTGTIGRALKDEGSYVEPGDSGLLAVAQQTDPIYVVFSISEREWLKWREEVEAGTIRANYTNPDGTPAQTRDPNPPVSVALLDGTHYPHMGRMNFFDSRVTPETGSATARAEFPNPDGLLLPGQFVRVTVTGWERPDSIIVPQRAVVQNPAGHIVMVVTPDDTIEVRPVTLGLWKDRGWLIEKGLNPGERVVADGLVRARPGAKVRTVAYVEDAAASGAGDGANGGTHRNANSGASNGAATGVSSSSQSTQGSRPKAPGAAATSEAEAKAPGAN